MIKISKIKDIIRNLAEVEIIQNRLSFLENENTSPNRQYKKTCHFRWLVNEKSPHPVLQQILIDVDTGESHWADIRGEKK